MKNPIIISLVFILAGAMLFSCSRSAENKIAGTWKVEDIKFNAGSQLDSAQVESSKKSAQSVTYELLEDNSARVHVGMTTLEGTWSYKKAESGVYMVFKGSFDTVLLGRYEEGKLVNVATRPDLTITTIFMKEGE